MEYSTVPIGMTASRNLHISKELIQKFAEATGDYNPLHLDESYATGTFFGGCIAHGMLAGSMISALIAEQFPGSIYLSQELHWILPVRPGDTIQASFEVLEKLDDTRHIVLSTHCHNHKGANVLRGKALIQIDRKVRSQD